jgi:hypothetical protein
MVCHRNLHDFPSKTINIKPCVSWWILKNVSEQPAASTFSVWLVRYSRSSTTQLKIRQQAPTKYKITTYQLTWHHIPGKVGLIHFGLWNSNLFFNAKLYCHRVMLLPSSDASTSEWLQLPLSNNSTAVSNNINNKIIISISSLFPTSNPMIGK